MIDSVVIATDGSEGVERAVGTAIDLAERFEAAIHALYVVDTTEVEAAPEDVREAFQTALRERGDRVLATVADRTEATVTTATREGRPPAEIVGYAREVEADLVALGTRGRHGEHRFLLGSVAERVVRSSPVPVMTVRHLAGAES